MVTTVTVTVWCTSLEKVERAQKFLSLLRPCLHGGNYNHLINLLLLFYLNRCKPISQCPPNPYYLDRPDCHSYQGFAYSNRLRVLSSISDPDKRIHKSKPPMGFGCHGFRIGLFFPQAILAYPQGTHSSWEIVLPQ